MKIDFSKPIGGWTLKEAEGELSHRMPTSLTLYRYEVGQMTKISPCESYEKAVPEQFHGKPQRVMWCYRPPNGDVMSILCALEVRAWDIGGVSATPRNGDPYYRYIVPIFAIHEESHEMIARYTLAIRRGLLTSSVTRQAATINKRQRKQQLIRA